MTEKQKAYHRTYKNTRYKNDPEFRERSLDASYAWKYANPDKHLLYVKRVYNKKCALQAGKNGDFEKMLHYVKIYEELGRKLGM